MSFNGGCSVEGMALIFFYSLFKHRANLFQPGAVVNYYHSRLAVIFPCGKVGTLLYCHSRSHKSCTRYVSAIARIVVQFFGTDPGASTGSGGNYRLLPALQRQALTRSHPFRSPDRLRFLFPDIGVQHGMDYLRKRSSSTKSQRRSISALISAALISMIFHCRYIKLTVSPDYRFSPGGRSLYFIFKFTFNRFFCSKKLFMPNGPGY